MSGENDVLPDEYPQSICDKFVGDHEVLEAWKMEFYSRRKP